MQPNHVKQEYTHSQAEKTTLVHGNIRENNKDEDKIQKHLNENKPNYQKSKY